MLAMWPSWCMNFPSTLLVEIDSIRWLQGLDLSPYFLAVARHMEKRNASSGSGRERPISWVHANGECTGLPDASFDVVSLAFVVR